jgi:nucleoside 2-deoxyribosyltransferase
MLKIYCIHQITGLTPNQVYDYYSQTQKILTDIGYDVFIPIYAKGRCESEKEFKAANYDSPLMTNHAIFTRDRFMVEQADVLYANFLGMKNASIGGMFELAWGSQLHKHIIVVMEKNNIHQHAFVLEAANIVLETEEEAITYLRKLSKKEY